MAKIPLKLRLWLLEAQSIHHAPASQQAQKRALASDSSAKMATNRLLPTLTASSLFNRVSNKYSNMCQRRRNSGRRTSNSDLSESNKRWYLGKFKAREGTPVLFSTVEAFSIPKPYNVLNLP